MKHSLSRPATSLGLCLAAAALTGCGGMAADTSLSAAQVRFVAVSSNAPEMDFLVNGAGAAYHVGFATYTSYLPVSPGAASIAANRTGTGLSLATVQATLAGGRQYTAVVSHALGALQTRLYQDQEIAAPTGEIAVRVLNETDGTRPLTVYAAPLDSGGIAGAPTVVTVPVGASAGYLNLPANAVYKVSATVGEAGITIPLASVTVKATPGSVRTVLFAGTTQAGGHGTLGFTLDDVDVP